MHMRRQRFAVLVSGGGTNLQALLDEEAAGRIPDGELALVISNREGAYALQRAQAHGKPWAAITKKKAGSQEAFEAELQETLEAYHIDFLVLAGFLAILSKDFTDRWPRRIINIHPSLIPSFCGAGFYGLRVHEAALARGVKVSGATVHYVNEIPDGGEILLQKAVEVQAGDTPETLQRRIMEQAEWHLLPEAAEMVARQLNENGGN